MKLFIESASITDRGLGTKKNVNEDSYLVLEKEKVFAVADGVGGAQAGDVASKGAVRAIKAVVQNEQLSATKSHLIDLVKFLIDTCNAEIYQSARTKQVEMASTIALLLIEEDFSVLAHVGDSRIYLYRSGKLHQLTKDHSKLQNLLDIMPPGTIDEKNFSEKNVITKALGIGSIVEPDIQKVNLKNQDIFILCTDGIYNYNTEDEIKTNVRKNADDLDEICQTFKKYCYEKGALDHLTAVVLKVTLPDADAQKTVAIKL